MWEPRNLLFFAFHLICCHFSSHPEASCPYEEGRKQLWNPPHKSFQSKDRQGKFGKNNERQSQCRTSTETICTTLSLQGNHPQEFPVVAEAFSLLHQCWQCWQVECEPVSGTISGFKAQQWLGLPWAELYDRVKALATAFLLQGSLCW